MKTFTKILLAAGLTTGLFNCADAQRGRDNDRRSGGERSGNSAVRSFPQSRPSDRSGGFSSQRNERPSSVYRGGNDNRSNQQRDMVRRDNVRPNTPSSVFRGNNTNRVGDYAYSRNRVYSRYDNYYAGNNRYGNNSRYNYNYNRGFSGDYYTFQNRRYSYMYGPRYSIIPRNSISIHFGGNPYYFSNGYFYGYYSGYYQPIFPPIGLRIGLLPFGYSSLYIGGNPFYYYNGVYYRQYDDNNYEVVDPPMGATVYNLPEGAKSVVLNGEELYELNGTYYRQEKNSKGEITYTVVGKNGEVNNSDDEVNSPGNNNIIAAPPSTLQVGDIVGQLPEGSKAVIINGEKMYVTPDNTYLQEDEDGNGNVQYKVVGQ